MTHDGLLYGAQPEVEGQKTLAVINAMIGDLGTWQRGLPLEDELRAHLGRRHDLVGTGRNWRDLHDRTLRPAACRPLPRRVHRPVQDGPYRRLAEGHYGGFFGWPNFSATPTGGFMGMPGTANRASLRVIDIYRRDGDKLAENWVFIDLLHFWKGQGVDILARMAEVPRT